MTCERVGAAIVCSRRSRKSLGKCTECWINEATKLCDGPSATARGKTCDKPLCQRCATTGGANVDYCKTHNTAEKRKLAL